MGLSQLNTFLKNDKTRPNIITQFKGRVDHTLNDAYEKPIVFNADTFVGNIMVQIADNPDRSPIFDSLLKPEGSEIYLRSTSNYTDCQSFQEVRELAFSQGEMAIGWVTIKGRKAYLAPTDLEQYPANAEIEIVVLAMD
jgi:hypothetical protein